MLRERVKQALATWKAGSRLRSNPRKDDSGRVMVTLAVMTAILGLGLELRALYHIVVHRESSFVADGLKALLIIGLGALFFWGRRK